MIGRRTTGNLTETVLTPSISQEDCELRHSTIASTSSAITNSQSDVTSHILQRDDTESFARQQPQVSVKKLKTKQNIQETFFSWKKK